MNSNEKYLRFELAKEMLQTPEIIRNFKLEGVANVIHAIKSTGKLFLTGEGSSRIFPAKNAIYSALAGGLGEIAIMRHVVPPRRDIVQTGSPHDPKQDHECPVARDKGTQSIEHPVRLTCVMRKQIW